MSKLYQPSPRVPASERLPILLARVVGRVVLTGHGEHVRRVQTRQHLLDLIELRRRRKVREVTGVDHEVGCVAEAVDLADGMAERIYHIGVRRPVESDMLSLIWANRKAGVDCCAAPPDPATCEITSPPVNREHHRCAEPSTMSDELTSAHPCRIGFCTHLVTTTVPS